jgi:hypothetical protein
MPDKNPDEIKIGKPRKNIIENSSEKEVDKNQAPEYHKLSPGDQDTEKGLGIDDELIPNGTDSSVDFNSSDDFNYDSDSDDRLETSEVVDAIVPQDTSEIGLPLTQPESMDVEDHAPPEKAENSLTSTDKIYIIPDETVSSIERDELISNLQKKIPNIIKQKHGEPPPEPAKKDPLESWEKQMEREILQQPKNEEPEPDILPPPSMNQESTIDGIAQFSGSRIYLPSIMKIKTGDEIVVRGKRFRAKKKAFDWKRIYLGTVLGIIIVMAIAFVMSRPSVPVIPGKVVGLVLNAKTGEVIPKAQVVLDEQGKTLFTNAQGMFVIDNLEPGTWSISASKPQYKTAAISFAHASGATSILTLSMDPSIAVVEKVESANAEKEKEPPPVKEVPIPNYGQLTVIANIPQARVIVDNKVLGPGNTTYSNITAGKHRLVVMAQGYKEFSGTIEVERNKNNKFNVELEKIKTEYVPSEITFEEYLVKADAMTSKKDWQEAIGNYTLALAKYEDGETYYKRSRAYVQMGQQTHAINDLFKASSFYTSEGRLNRAIECLNEILDWRPEYTKAYRERGFAYLRLGDFEQAIEDLKEAIDINDDDFDNHMALGEAYYIIGEHGDALKYLRKARNINDSNARVFALSALASLAKGEKGDAGRYYKEFEERANAQDRAEFAGDPDWQTLSDMFSQKDD